MKALRKKPLLYGCVGLLLVLALGLKFANTEASEPHPQLMKAAADLAAASKENARLEPDHSIPSETPAPHPSLVGTDVNGGIRLNRAGHVVYHRDIRRLFDYYLSLRGRMSNAEIRRLLEEHLKNSAVQAGTDETLALFDKYLELIDAESKMAEEWIERDMTAANQVTSVLEERRNLRRERLGDELSEAFYAEQETYEAYQLERMKISTDASLTAEQKAAALAAAENILSPEQREIRKQTFAWLDIKKAARQPIESLDADTAEAIRQKFGENALDRLAAVAHEKDEWDDKRKAWLAEKARIEARSDLTASEKKASLLEYANAHLDRGEQRRMEALDSDQAAM